MKIYKTMSYLTYFNLSVDLSNYLGENIASNVEVSVSGLSMM